MAALRRETSRVEEALAEIRAIYAEVGARPIDRACCLRAE